jgi:hypothetical protein
MSAQAAFEERRDVPRSTVLGTALAAGVPALAAVALGGLSLGFLLWYAAVTRLNWPLGVDATFVAAMVGGLILAFAGWYGYGSYFARRADVSSPVALQWDALSWALVGVYPLGLRGPVERGHAVPRLVRGARAVGAGQVAGGGALRADGSRRAADLRGHARRRSSSSPNWPRR